MSHGMPRRVGVRRYSSFVDLVNKECKLQVKPGALHPIRPRPLLPPNLLHQLYAPQTKILEG